MAKVFFLVFGLVALMCIAGSEAIPLKGSKVSDTSGTVERMKIEALLTQKGKGHSKGHSKSSSSSSSRSSDSESEASEDSSDLLEEKDIPQELVQLPVHDPELEEASRVGGFIIGRRRSFKRQIGVKNTLAKPEHKRHGDDDDDAYPDDDSDSSSDSYGRHRHYHSSGNSLMVNMGMTIMSTGSLLLLAMF